MEEDLNIIQKQCSIDRKEAETLYACAKNDVSLAITMFIDPNYTSPIPNHTVDKFSEFRQILDEKDNALKDVLAKKQTEPKFESFPTIEEEAGFENDGVEENKDLSD